ncbi:hypothetical protein Nwi_1467 [Nitrobacter winogradskyi Nb-255]|uniref:PilZ domain-containing protein n=1 Tax=Nitrobacter winogradskyi (strain ATCC 25391 / DSM 10237 / CIP 104748 / NCIMB 11846 / Nb-255) TaxID=323098 RepID=Q3SSL3_NITWN|nr:PilZ domain-containing protein [Nitrobacter winogradskyi]ABA04728.1 hypothetical protein Nwi_1467 [Nitrobacter winogradskyi Nb-255]
MNSPTEDRRKHPRVEIDEPAYISMGGFSMRCRLLNVSPEGAALEVPNPASVPLSFQLMTEKDRVIRGCRVIWTKQNRIGVAFDQPTAEAGFDAPSRNS